MATLTFPEHAQLFVDGTRLSEQAEVRWVVGLERHRIVVRELIARGAELSVDTEKLLEEKRDVSLCLVRMGDGAFYGKPSGDVVQQTGKARVVEVEYHDEANGWLARITTFGALACDVSRGT